MIYLAALFLFSFAFIIFRGAPFVVSKNASVEDAIDLLSLSAGQTVVDFGCGSGRVLEMFSRHNIKAVGYELNPILFMYCYLRFKDNPNITVLYGDFMRSNLDGVNAVYVFSAGPYLAKLTKKLKQYSGLKILSVGFELPGLVPKRRTERVFMYQIK